jgi:acetoin utilization protein AcuB
MAQDILIDEFTTPCPLVIDAQESCLRALDLMIENDIRHLPVVSGDQVVGIVSNRDLQVYSMLDAKDFLAVGEIMVESPFIVSKNDPLLATVYQMSANKIGSAIVVDEAGKLDGIFTTTDALNALIEVLQERDLQQASEFKL